MSATGSLGTRIYTASSPVANTTTAVDAVTDFQMLTIDQEISPVQNLGEFSRLFELVTFNALADGRTLKIKGPYNDGTLQMSVAMDLSSAGQAIMFTASQTTNQDNYPFKITFTGTDAYHAFCYFAGLPMSYRIIAGAANTVLLAQINIEVNSTVFLSDS